MELSKAMLEELTTGFKTPQDRPEDCRILRPLTNSRAYDPYQ